MLLDTWDVGTRAGLIDFRGGVLEVHEFPYDAINEAIWPSAAQKEKQPPDVSKMIPMSDFVRSGGQPMLDVVEQIYAEINERYETDIAVPGAGQNDD